MIISPCPFHLLNSMIKMFDSNTSINGRTIDHIGQIGTSIYSVPVNWELLASDKVVPVLGKNRCALGKCVSQKSCL